MKSKNLNVFFLFTSCAIHKLKKKSLCMVLLVSPKSTLRIKQRWS